MNNQKSRVSVLYCLTVLAIISPLAIAQDASDNSEGSQILEELIVTGSFIRRASQADVASPLTSVTAEDMDRVGAFNATDLVNTLTVNSGSQNENDGFNQSFSLGTTNINLRGLGVSSTLTLLNGRRQALTASTTLNGDQFTDLNSLVPTIAIGRVEILEDGASTLYGSDAVAGVANFITRKNFVGAEVKLDYKTTSSDSQNDLQASFLFGGDMGGGDNTSIIGALSFFNRSPLSATERRNDFELRDANSIFGAPGTFLVFRAGPPSRVADPSCLALAQTDPETTTGIVIPGNCGFDFGDYFRLVAEEDRVQSYVELNTEFSDGTEFFAELGYSANDIISTGSPSQPILFPPFVPVFNPAFQDPALANVAGATGAIFFGRVEGTGSAASQINISSDTFRLATGFRGDLTDHWSWESSLTYSENTYNYSNPSDTLVDRFSDALFGRGGPNNNQFYNPIFGSDNDSAVREDFRGTYAFEATSELLTVNAFVSGSVGEMGVAVGMQYRASELAYDYNDAAENDNLFFFRGNESFSDDRDAYAVFVETDIPLSDDLSLQAAVRYEDIDGFNTTDPKLGFRWRPTGELSFRGTVSSSFRAPSLFQTSGGLTAPARIFDPVVDGLATISQRTTGDVNNPIKPQESDAFNLGATWRTDNDLTISLDYWKFDYTNFITPENATAIVAVDPNGVQVTRAGDSPTGALVAVTTFFRNAGQLETDGLDLSISKDFGKQFRFVADISKILGYDLDDPVLGPVDGLGQRNFTNFGSPTPELRANLGLLWTAENQSANVYWRYIDSYVDENNANVKIANFSTVSAQYRYDFEDVLGIEELGLTFGVKDLFDELAPDVVSRSGFDSLTHSPLGRQIYISLKGSF